MTPEQYARTARALERLSKRTRAYEIRRDEDGELDEVVAPRAAVRLERMDVGARWLGIDLPDGTSLHVWITARNEGRTQVRGVATVDGEPAP